MGTTTRRGLLGTIALAPIATAAIPATIPVITGATDWCRIVAHYHAARAAWLVACEEEDERTGAFYDAKASLPPKPQQPPSGLPDDIEDMTIRQIKASGAGKDAWDQYALDLAAWEQRRDALEQEIVGPAAARLKAAYAAYAAATDALRTHRPRIIVELREKVEILAADYQGCDIPDECFAEIVADLRHLAGEARA